MSGTRRSGLPSDGYFGMVAHWPKSPTNINTLWRSASLYGAAFVGTIGARYQRQPSDAIGTPNLVPLIDYTDIDDLITRLPHDCLLVVIELHECAKMLPEFSHPERAVYLLGAEDHGLPPAVVDRCHYVVRIPPRDWSTNVAVTGPIVMYDRAVKS
jgi:tRNA G18 (ribose-2'-O)-methylase SpoU